MKKITSLCTALTVLLGMTLSMPITAGADDSADFQIRIVHTNDITTVGIKKFSDKHCKTGTAS